MVYKPLLPVFQLAQDYGAQEIKSPKGRSFGRNDVHVYGILGDAVEAHPGNVLKPPRALVVEFASVRFLSSVSEAPSGLSQLRRRSFRRRALSRIPSAPPDPACGSAPACARSRRFCRDSRWGLLKRAGSLWPERRGWGVLIQPLP